MTTNNIDMLLPYANSNSLAEFFVLQTLIIPRSLIDILLI